MIRQRFTTLLGKSVRAVAQARGGGSALPGLVVEKVDPGFVPRTLGSLAQGVVLVSGTNGKTTTTKMVVELLEGQGLTVFTNRTGSNFARGVAAALLGAVDIHGKLDADIAVLELDEAHAVHFVRVVPPKYCLLLNVLRDQLDRFGEIDTTASMLHTIALRSTAGVVLNRDDPRLARDTFTRDIKVPIATYSVAPTLRALFPSDDAMRGAASDSTPHATLDADNTSLESVDGQRATIRFNDTSHDVTLQLKGIYNVQNAVGAVALTRMVMGAKLDENRMLASLQNVTPAFGRGETVMINDLPCELLLVKNPSGFRLSLTSFDPADYATMIAINDNYADGRDMSWLWDVDFDSLAANGVAIVSGMRAYDMALRLQYDEVPLAHVEPDLALGLAYLLREHADKPKRIYCTYTAMLTLRKLLAKQTNVEVVR